MRLPERNCCIGGRRMGVSKSASFSSILRCMHKPSASAKKGFGMWSLIATILVLAFLVSMAWPWLQKAWKDLTSWLQQIKVPQQEAAATITPSERLYVFPQRTHESRDHFEALGEEQYPRPYPRPVLLDRWKGNDVFRWKG